MANLRDSLENYVVRSTSELLSELPEDRRGELGELLSELERRATDKLEAERVKSAERERQLRGELELVAHSQASEAEARESELSRRTNELEERERKLEQAVRDTDRELLEREQAIAARERDLTAVSEERFSAREREVARRE